MKNFWDNHGIFFLIFITFFPRLTMLFAVTVPFGFLAWLGWLFVPHLTVAILATKYYWHQNPILCIIAWFVALTGTGGEYKIVQQGIDRNHNPEFYFNGTTQIPYTPTEGGETVYIELKAPWKRMSMKESLLHYGQLDVDRLNDEEMRAMLRESGHCDVKKLPGLSRGLLIAALFEVLVEPHLIQPHHIFDHAVETTPLCKLHHEEK